MPVNPNDPRYRSGWDSYPEDYTNGIKNSVGRAADDYMDKREHGHSSPNSNSNPSNTGNTPYNGGGVVGGSGRGWG